MPRFILSIVLAFLFICCNDTTSASPDRESLKQEIIDTENAFCKMALEKGLSEAFYTFADSNAVIRMANDSLIRGKNDIRENYKKPRYLGARLTWAPDFVDVSDDGTLGYTYGHYEWVSMDSAGVEQKFTGMFHTVWKKQKDGSWKYVWD